MNKLDIELINQKLHQVSTHELHAKQPSNILREPDSATDHNGLEQVNPPELLVLLVHSKRPSDFPHDGQIMPILGKHKNLARQATQSNGLI